MDEKITEFGKQLNAVQMKFIARPVLEVQSYEYAMIRLFTNLITREGEIHCLLQNGYVLCPKLYGQHKKAPNGRKY